MVRYGRVGVVLLSAVLVGWLILGWDSTATPQSSQPHLPTQPTPTGGDIPVVSTSPVTEAEIPTAATPSSSAKTHRAVVPLLLTHLKYHGTELLATTIKGWVLKLFVPQGNMDLVVFYDVSTISVADLIKLLKLAPAPSWVAEVDVSSSRVTVPSKEAAVLGNGRFVTPHHNTFELVIVPVALTLPKYIVANPSVLNRSDWMKCGCPPYCPPRKSTVEYIQGTRWYSHDLFLEPIIARYKYWLKLDVDIWVFREFPINFVDTLSASGMVAAHTGKAYNGEGCSNELDVAIRTHQKCSLQRRDPCESIVSSKEGWWQQDDNVFYTNFVMYEVAFFMREDVMTLSKFLNEYERGFFKYRWTDQSLAHKVLGVYHGPNETSVALDWSGYRWKKKIFRAKACFWHGKKSYSGRQLAQFTVL